MRRWRERYQEGGYDGLYDRRKRRPSPKRVPLQTAERVLQLYREKYYDFNVRHFHEKLTEEHGIGISYTWVKMALQGAGLVNRQRRCGAHRRRRHFRKPRSARGNPPKARILEHSKGLTSGSKEAGFRPGVGSPERVAGRKGLHLPRSGKDFETRG